MIIAKVIGSVWATRKEARLAGFKLLVVQPIDIREKETASDPLVAIDMIGAGIGETVLCLLGSPARVAAGGGNVPVDAAVAGIVDGYEIEETEGSGC